MLEHFGYDRFRRDCGAREISADGTGKPRYLEMRADERPMLTVEVVNATPEPDGASRV